MLQNMPFMAKWQVDAGGIYTFGGNGAGTVLIAYEIEIVYGGTGVALQLVCDVPNANVPGDLPFMTYSPLSGNVAVLVATGTYPDDYIEIVAGTLGVGRMQFLWAENLASAGMLGSWPTQVTFGWNLNEDPAPGAPYYVPLYTPSATMLRQSITGATYDYSWVALAGEDYSALSLPGANFAHADLTGTKLSGSAMPNANFQGVISVSGAAMTGCDLAGANFTGVDLTHQDLSGGTLDGAIVAGARLTNARFAALGSTPTSLQHVDFSKVVSLTGAVFTGANLTGASFAHLDVTGVDFGGATLVGTDFTGCDLTKATFSAPPTFSKSNAALTIFAGATLPASLIALDWSYLDLTNATIVDLATDLSGLKAVWATLVGLQLTSLTITGADFSNATLQDVGFDGSDLSGSTFVSAQLQGDAETKAATLSGCMLRDANFTGANLTNADLSNAYFYGSNASLEGATVAGARFPGAYLTGLDFSGVRDADFLGVTFTNACLVNTVFRNCTIRDDAGGPTMFDGACLHGADFTGATLGKVEMYNAGVALTPGSITLTIPIKGVPIGLPTPYQPTLGLTAATHASTTCPSGVKGPCSTADLAGPNPPTQWPAAGAHTPTPAALTSAAE